jgi:hypothetical protein
MGVGDVHNLGEYQVGEQPWLIYGGVPQYGTYHIATLSFTTTVDGTVWQNKDGGNLSNQMDAAPPASPAWLPLWVQYHSPRGPMRARDVSQHAQQGEHSTMPRVQGVLA